MIKLEKVLWDIQRFGLDISGIKNRTLGSNAKCKVILNSIPKSGTHLIERTVCLHPDFHRPLIKTITPKTIKAMGLNKMLTNTEFGNVFVSHLPYNFKDEVTQDYKIIFMIRNPRDIIKSQQAYILKKENHYLHKTLTVLSEREQLNFLINKSELFEGIIQRLKDYQGWLNQENVLVVPFEKLIGAKGGGGNIEQKKVVGTIFEYLNIQISSAELNSFVDKTFFKASPTFSQGRVGIKYDLLDNILCETLGVSDREVISCYGY